MSARAGLDKEFLERTGINPLHVGMLLTEEERAEFIEDVEMISCCMGAAVYGPERCTCWEPVYSQERSEPQGGCLGFKSERCAECAYQADSAEWQDPEAREHLLSLASNERSVFVCHEGMAYIVEWRHPSGRVRKPDGDEVGRIDTWAPLYLDGIAFKADGTPADLCAGFLRQKLRNLEGR